MPMKAWTTTLIVGLLSSMGTSPAFAQQSAPERSIVEKWLGSGHGNAESPSFTHWNAEGEIPANCAVCHSGEGFRAFYGLDGSGVGVLDHPVPTGGVIDCATCHDDGAMDIAAVTFPSGAVIEPQGTVATCMTCHQGRQSGMSISRATEGQADHALNPELAFINPHYAPAAATLLGTEVNGAYEYPGKTYSGRFAHVPPFATCVDCHDPHSLEIEVQSCVGCHQTEDLRAIRTSTANFDGTGDSTSGIYVEIENLKLTLYAAIEGYASSVSGTGIEYADRFPYFFVDGAELTPANRYNAWTPALLRAAYNYQFISKDKGAYAHNPHYAIQILHDSIENLALESGQDFQLGARPE